MSSVRDQLVTSIAGHLSASLGISQDSVFETLTAAVQHDELPALCVDWDTDDALAESRDEDDEGEEIQVRSLSIQAMVLAESRSAVDALALDAEKAIATSSIGRERTLVGSAHAVEHDGRKAIHGVLITWEIEYHVTARSPDVAL